MGKLKVWFKIIWFCLQATSTKRINLGNTVYYEGLKWIAINSKTGGASWDLGDLERTRYKEYVPRSQIKKPRTVTNFIQDIQFTYGFYMGYWFDIWVRAEQGDEHSMKTIRNVMPRPK